MYKLSISNEAQSSHVSIFFLEEACQRGSQRAYIGFYEKPLKASQVFFFKKKEKEKLPSATSLLNVTKIKNLEIFCPHSA